MTRGWRWETPGEYLQRRGDTLATLVTLPPNRVALDYEVDRRQLCKACGGTVRMLTCHFHAKPRTGGVDAMTHLICPDCGRCVDDLAP